MHSQMVRFAFAIVLTAVAPAAHAAVPSVSHSHADSPLVARITSQHIRLTLIVPKRSYPANALVRLNVTVQNTSSATAHIQAWGYCEFPKLLPAVENLDKHGQGTLLPIPVGFYPAAECPSAAGHNALAGHHAVTQQVWVLLLGPYLRAALLVADASYDHHTEIDTPKLRVSLTRSDAPTIHVLGAGLTVRLSVRARGKPSGFWYSDNSQCRKGVVPRGVYRFWTAAGRTIRPGCNPVATWQIA